MAATAPIRVVGSSRFSALLGRSRGGWILRRVLTSLLTILISTIALFLLIRLLPGDPILAMSGAGIGSPTPEELQLARERYGLDDPMPLQYLRWVGAAVQGDFGLSAQNGAAVGDLIMRRLPVTLSLSVFAMIIAVAIGAGGGALAAVKRGKPADIAVTSAGTLGISIPNFWLGLLLILVLAIWVPVFPAGGYTEFAADPLGWLRGMVLPAVMLGVGLGSLLLRQMRSAMVGELQERYVDTARMKGLGGFRVAGHAFRNCLIPLVTITGLQLGSLISGTVVAEQLFVLPGLGSLLLQGVGARDYAVVQAVALVMVVGYVLISIIVDLLYAVLDPRVKAGGA